MMAADDSEYGKPTKSVGRYRKVEVRTWGDEKFASMSAIPPCGQGLWLFLITGPHTGPIPGLFRAGRAAMAEELNWDLEAFDKAFEEVFQQGMAKADFKSRVVWVPNAIRYNKPESPNVVRGWAAEFDLIPECALKREALLSLKASIHSLGEAYGKAFDEVFGKPSGKASVKPLPKTMPNQEQEQEQEQENKHAQLSRQLGRGVETPKPRARAVDNSTSESRAPSPAELAVQAMAKAGLPGVAAGHPEVLALIDKGVTPDAFGAAAAKSVAKGKAFEYAVGVLRGQLVDAVGIAAGPSAGHLAWDRDRPSVEAEGQRLGLGTWCGMPTKELFSAYTERVRQAREAQHETSGV